MAKKFGLSKTPPVNEASYQNDPRYKFSAIISAGGVIVNREVPPKKPAPSTENFLNKGVDTVQLAALESDHTESATTPLRKDSTLLTLKNLNKKNTQAIYGGSARTFQIPLANFPNGQAPATLDVPGLVAKVTPEAKPKMTAEERKAARDAQPKPTAAEALAQAEARSEKRLAKLREKAAAELQPAL